MADLKVIIVLLCLGLVAWLLIRNLILVLNPPTNNNLPTISVVFNQKEYLLEIARSNSERAAGLSNRKELCPTCGMIFIFGQDTTLPFWMKDTLIPLDMVWLDHQGQIVSIATANPEPGVALNQLKIYQNSTPAKYVIELNAGDSQKLNLRVGETINLPYDQL
ncbi:DUF192 domain-containing protein [Patescibacteria group bacterium]|nr:DUF192 domain-containing protein [Patescibacteria group bacterium]